MNNTTRNVTVIGAGLAGSEAAFQLAESGLDVRLVEMRPETMTPAHETDSPAELVCSNSFRADDSETSAIGLLHEELRQSGSLILKAADETRVPAGGALAVDRTAFAKTVRCTLHDHPRIHMETREVTALPEAGETLVATGPLTSAPLAEAIGELTGSRFLHFFDARAPIVYTDSIDFSKAWRQSRYDRGETADYINCPLNETEYNAFVDALRESEQAPLHDFEKNAPYFEGCLPVEVMAERGRETLSFGPMKPVGLNNPHTKETPYAVVQLRADNAAGTLQNLVGFQTRMKHGDQKRVFRMIPGLENARFARLGGMHRNTFLNSPHLLKEDLRLEKAPHVAFAGQITGCEGYVESTAVGWLAGRFTADRLHGRPFAPPPDTTAMGALLAHITRTAETETFQPMNINFGLFPPLPKPAGKRKLRKRERRLGYTTRAKKDLETWLT